MSDKRQRYAPEMALRRAELERLALDRFDFLVLKEGFIMRSSERAPQWTTYCYTYTDPGAPIGIEVQLDFRDDTVRVYLLRLRDGELPSHGFVDVDRRERIRVSFLLLLKGILHVEGAQLDALSSLLCAAPSGVGRGFAWADDALARWREIVECHIAMVAQQPLEPLFPPPPPGASAASQA